MKKLLALLVVLALTVSLFVGCSAPTAEDATTEEAVTEEAAVEEAAEEVTEETAETASDEVITLDVGMMGTSIKPVGVIVADAMGYFEEEGVAVNFEKVSSMNDAYLAVSTGDLDVYLFSSTAAATFISQGTTTLRVFGGTAAEGSEIMAPAGSGIVLDSADDFVGLTVGCFMAETGQMVLKNYLMEQGYTIGQPGEDVDVAFVYYSDTNGGIEACKNGEYDIVLTNSSMGYYAEDLGVDVIANVSDFVEVYPCCRQTCNETTYTDEFDALVAFEIAALRGYAYSQENPEETLDILVEYAGEDRGFLEGQIYGNENYTPAMRLSLDPDSDACVAFYNAMMNLGEIEDTIEVDWRDYVVTDVYSTALQNLMDREPDNALWAELMEYHTAHNTGA